jgi:hypothetical protein
MMTYLCQFFFCALSGISADYRKKRQFIQNTKGVQASPFREVQNKKA